LIVDPGQLALDVPEQFAGFRYPDQAVVDPARPTVVHRGIPGPQFRRRRLDPSDLCARTGLADQSSRHPGRSGRSPGYDIWATGFTVSCGRADHDRTRIFHRTSTRVVATWDKRPEPGVRSVTGCTELAPGDRAASPVLHPRSNAVGSSTRE